MDINAGRYLDGEPMEQLAAESVELLIATASGQQTRGEHAGHSQVSLWRNWRQTDGTRVAEILGRSAPDGVPLKTAADLMPTREPAVALPLQLYQADGDRGATERIGLVLPTSMCSAQIARLASDRMNRDGLARSVGLTRFVTLTHTEGCGFGGETMYQLLQRTYRGYATHPNVAAALLLEHGCEKIPNDAMRRQFEAAGLPLERFGWASVQLDGGIDQSLAKIAAWFEQAGAALPPSHRRPADLGALNVGLVSALPFSAEGALVAGRLTRAMVAAGGTVLMPESDPLLGTDAFRSEVLGATAPRATLAYGQPFKTAGFHLVATETDHWVENLAGLGGCGAHLFLGWVGDAPQQGHPMLPLLQIAEPGVLSAAAEADVDVVLSGNVDTDEATLTGLLISTASGDTIVTATAGGFVDFQLSRGLLGVST